MNVEMINSNQSLSWQTDDNKVLYERGEELAFAGQYQEALACIDQALAIQSVSHAAWILKGVIQVQLGQYQEALICCDKALAIAPSDRQAWIVRGAALN